MKVALLLSIFALTVMATDSYTILVFNLEWPTTNCLSGQCPSGYEYQDFNIHGLWPSFSTAESGPSYCSNVPYANNSSLEARMKQHWRSDAQSDVDFWTHEWTKHGTCFKEGEQPEEFFTTVLNLQAQYDPMSMLDDAGHQPDNDTKIYMSDLYGAFKYDINVTCYSKGGKNYLQTVEQCFNPDLTPVNCPRKSNDCEQYLYWPSTSNQIAFS